MRAGIKLSIALVAFLLAVGLGACGGDDDSGSTSATTDPAAQSEQGGGDSTKSDAPTGDAAGSGSASGKRQESPEGEDENSAGAGSEDFVPRQHEDSGGGSDQYVVRGGDNSVQEFGAEADEAERDAAATALHNFLDARAQGAWDAACSYLSSEVRESLEMFVEKAQEAAEREGKSAPVGSGCGAILAGLTNRAALPELRKEAAEVDVRSLRVEGDRAFVIYTDAKGTVIAIPVVKEDGDWKVGSLAGAPIA